MVVTTGDGMRGAAGAPVKAKDVLGRLSFFGKSMKSPQGTQEVARGGGLSGAGTGSAVMGGFVSRSLVGLMKKGGKGQENGGKSAWEKSGGCAELGLQSGLKAAGKVGIKMGPGGSGKWDGDGDGDDAVMRKSQLNGIDSRLGACK